MKIQSITWDRNTGSYLVRANDTFYFFDKEYVAEFGDPSLKNRALVDALRRECVRRASIYLHPRNNPCIAEISPTAKPDKSNSE